MGGRVERSGQMLFWTIVGSTAAVLSLLVGLKQCTGGSTASTASGSGSTGHSVSAPTTSVRPSTTRPSTASAHSLVYLADMTPAGDLGFSVEQRPALIYGNTYPKSIAFTCGNPSPGETPGTYSLNRKATRFMATVGVEAKWPTSYLVGVSVVGDGRTLRAFSVGVLKPKKISVNVTNVTLLQLECSFAVDTSSSDSTGGYVAEVSWGNARVAEGG
jgi:NPCBM/NEW2 domain